MSRIRTGITELDDMLRGGFMKGDAVMVAGSAGTGKTVLCLQYLVNGANRFGENGIYVTFEQLPDQIYRDAETLGWNLHKLEEENKLRIVCTSPNLLLESNGGEHLLDEPIKEVEPQRIVIDSLSHLAMYVDEREMRKEAYRLIMYLKTKELSSLSTWESPQLVGQTFSITEIGLSFLVDCIILLRLVEMESSMKKVLVVLKMRGSDHDKQLRQFDVTPRGIEVASPLTDYEGIITGSPNRIPPFSEEAVRGWAEAFRRKRK